MNTVKIVLQGLSRFSDFDLDYFKGSEGSKSSPYILDRSQGCVDFDGLYRWLWYFTEGKLYGCSEPDTGFFVFVFCEGRPFSPALRAFE